jgi:plastocyanin
MTNPVARRSRISGMRLLTLAVLLLLVALPAAGAGATRADNPVLTGDVGAGDSFAISLTGPTGSPVRNLDPGTYTLLVNDHSTIHNFHLFGPGGVNAVTDVDATGDFTFTVTLVAGTYNFDCDAHASTMKGSFTVGTAPAPTPTPTPTPTPVPKATTLRASVGPGATIALGSSNGTPLSRVTAGAATIVVNDRSKNDNFHLVGPGVSKATGVSFKGKVTWKLTLKAGKYTYKSDKHPVLHGSFSVKS